MSADFCDSPRCLFRFSVQTFIIRLEKISKTHLIWENKVLWGRGIKGQNIMRQLCSHWLKIKVAQNGLKQVSPNVHTLLYTNSYSGGPLFCNFRLRKSLKIRGKITGLLICMLMQIMFPVFCNLRNGISYKIRRILTK